MKGGSERNFEEIEESQFATFIIKIAEPAVSKNTFFDIALSYYSVTGREVPFFQPSTAIISRPSLEGCRNILLHLLFSCAALSLTLLQSKGLGQSPTAMGILGLIQMLESKNILTYIHRLSNTSDKDM